MRSLVLACAALALTAPCHAFVPSTTLPPECHPSFVKSLEKADEAVNGRDYQYGLALCHGILYTGGVTIKVDERTVTNNRQANLGAVATAVQTWQAALGKDCPLKLVPSTETAQVTIQYVDKIPRESADALGLIELQKSYRWNRTRFEFETKATIYVQRTYEGKVLPQDHLEEIVCHELGHLLGLADVEHTGHLMGPMVIGEPVSGPLPHEIRAIKLLREAARTKVSEIEKLLSPGESAEFRYLHQVQETL